MGKADKAAIRAEAARLVNQGGLSLDHINQELRATFGQGLRKQDLATLRRTELHLPPRVDTARYTPVKYQGPRVLPQESLKDGRQTWQFTRHFVHHFRVPVTLPDGSRGYKYLSVGTNELPNKRRDISELLQDILDQNAADYNDVPQEGPPEYLYTIETNPPAKPAKGAGKREAKVKGARKH